MQKVTPFLSFDGQAEEAARFYVSLLPDSRIDRVTRSPLDTPSGPAGTRDGGSVSCNGSVSMSVPVDSWIGRRF